MTKKMGMIKIRSNKKIMSKTKFDNRNEIDVNTDDDPKGQVIAFIIQFLFLYIIVVLFFNYRKRKSEIKN